MSDRYYVYVYIDPRNFEEFYYGKGTGSRSHAHLKEDGDSEKLARIKAIRAEGMEPIIRVIARGLTSEEALMVETALIWKLGRTLTNVAAGQYVGRFRPMDTMHKRLAHFDFQNGLYYFNVGEGDSRNWDDNLRYGFLAAGGGPQWSKHAIALEPGDVVVGYLSSHGYVGVGVVQSPAVPYRDYRHDGKLLADLPLQNRGIAHDVDNLDLCEYIVAVDWKAAVAREQAAWQPKSGLFAKPLVRASLDNQPVTVAFVEQAFDIKDLRSLADNDEGPGHLAVDPERLGIVDAALKYEDRSYVKVSPTYIAAQANGRSHHKGLYIGWAWGENRRGTFLEFLTDHRSSGMSGRRIFADGTEEYIGVPLSQCMRDPDPAKDAELEAKFLEHNRKAYSALRERGLLPPVGSSSSAQDMTEYLITGGEVS